MPPNITPPINVPEFPETRMKPFPKAAHSDLLPFDVFIWRNIKEIFFHVKVVHSIFS